MKVYLDTAVISNLRGGVYRGLDIERVAALPGVELVLSGAHCDDVSGASAETVAAMNALVRGGQFQFALAGGSVFQLEFDALQLARSTGESVTAPTVIFRNAEAAETAHPEFVVVTDCYGDPAVVTAALWLATERKEVTGEFLKTFRDYQELFSKKAVSEVFKAGMAVPWGVPEGIDPKLGWVKELAEINNLFCLVRQDLRQTEWGGFLFFSSNLWKKVPQEMRKDRAKLLGLFRDLTSAWEACPACCLLLNVSNDCLYGSESTEELSSMLDDLVHLSVLPYVDVFFADKRVAGKVERSKEIPRSMRNTIVKNGDFEGWFSRVERKISEP